MLPHAEGIVPQHGANSNLRNYPFGKKSPAGILLASVILVARPRPQKNLR